MNADEAETGCLGWLGDRRDRPAALLSMSHFLIEVVFIAHLATLNLHRLISLSDRTRIENTLNRF